MAEKKCLVVTIVDHAAAMEENGEESYINVRIPLALAEAGLKLLPVGKLGNISPELIVEMIEEGVTGELINIADKRKTISVRIE